MEDYKTTIRNAVMDECAFLKLTLGGALQSDSPWVKVVIRPVEIKGRRKVQFSYFDGLKDITKNYSGDEVTTRLDEVLAIPFTRIHLHSTAGDINIKITKKGTPVITRAEPSLKMPDLTHDHVKDQPLPANDPFLQSIGIANERGEIRPGMQAKFRQVNQFLRIIQQTVPKIEPPIRIVDCGCGSAYLTFAAYHYLKDVLGLQVEVLGIDVSEELVGKCSALRDSLGWKDIGFQVARIADFEPETPPNVVLSLHACDTATDEAIAKGILWGSEVILAAPCCQHELHDQLHMAEWRPVLRHGILKERLADILTDAFRASVLRIMGYRTSVVEFVSPDATSKNLMIRAEKGLKPGDTRHVSEYKRLKKLLNVSPCIERLIGEDFEQWVMSKE
jgi:SAM-dependent methyltransferase